jgi:fructuronate reductase
VSNGALDQSNDQFRADLEVLRNGGINVISAPARLVAGLRARCAAGVGPMAVMSCDNLPNNGAVLRTVTVEAAALVDPVLATWIAENISFVTTMVDRITPRVTDEDVARINAGIGTADGSPIVAEPFGEWVISGEFPAGRPNWESAGVTFAPDVEPHERRKLWLLNGSHSLLAYVGLHRGFTYVDEAMQDPVCDATVVQWWQQAIEQLEGEPNALHAYAAELRKRYENPRIRYLLAQIGTDGSLKIPVRWIPATKAMRAAGVMPTAAARGLAAYGFYLHGDDVRDARKDALLQCVGSDVPTTVRKFLEFVAPELLTDTDFIACIDGEIAQLSS